MLAQIAKGPMSVCVDATLWQTYVSGVITAASGCGTSIDHAVQAIGYNSAGNYWIVRNSWGESWGELGFARVKMGLLQLHKECVWATPGTYTLNNYPCTEDGENCLLKGAKSAHSGAWSYGGGRDDDKDDNSNDPQQAKPDRRVLAP